MSADNRLHFFRMAAWDMFDPDQLDRRERKVRLRQIRQVFDDCGFHLDISIGGDSKGNTYPVYTLRGKPASGEQANYWPLYGNNRKIGPLCRKALDVVNEKFPPKPER